MTQQEFREALEELAGRALGSAHPKAKAGSSVAKVDRSWSIGPYEGAGMGDPDYNISATIQVHPFDGEDDTAAKWAEGLREALRADEFLGGRSKTPVRVFPAETGREEFVVVIGLVDD
jgi:hypothetical protein